jgi:RHS repeat-associated protein
MMKKVRSCLSHLTLTFVLALATSVPLALVSQPINKYLNDLGPSTPNAAAMQQHTDQKINTATGTPDIGVDIFTMKEGPIEVPINLSYHAGGIKLGESASWVGLGWSLSGQGMISRQIVGYKDDGIHGYMTGECEDEHDNNLTATEADNIIVGKVDCEPDVFYINIPGYSGKMVYARHKEVGGGWYVYNHSDIKVQEYTLGQGHPITHFEITTPDGNIYLLGEEHTEVSRYGPTYNDALLEEEVTTIWYLKKITSADGLHAVTYTYTDEHVDAINIGSNEATDIAIAANGASCGGTGGVTLVRTNYTLTDGKRLVSITNSSGTESITFVPQSGYRQDLVALRNAALSPKALDKIEIRYGAERCAKYQMTYTYANPSASFHFQKRLVLNQVQYQSCLAGTSIPPYVFTYDDVDALPSRLSKQVDEWGYYNGEAGNESHNTLIPNNAYVLVGGVKVYHGSPDPYISCIRRPNADYMKKGSLIRVKYPTSGYTQYTYEPHTEYGCRRTGIYVDTINNRHSNCSMVAPAFNHITTCKSFTAAELMSIDFKIETHFTDASPNGCPSMPPGRFVVKLTAMEDYTSTPISSVYTYTVNDPSATDITPYMHMQSMFSPPLSADVPYRFLIEILPVMSSTPQADVYLKVRYLPEENNIIGGLRIKKIESRETDFTAPITANYEYNDAANKSTGVVLIEPLYGYTAFLNIGLQIFLKKFSSSPLNNIADMNGYTIAYKKVTKKMAGQGKEEYNYAPTKQVNISYPILPLAPVYTNGSLLKKEVIDELGIVVEANKLQYEVPDLSSLIAMQSPQYKLEKYVCNSAEEGLFYTSYLDVGFNNYIPSYPRVVKDTSIMQGVTNIKTIGYDITHKYTYPNSSTQTNSDGKVHEEKTYYTHDYDVGIYRAPLELQNKLLPPWKTEKYVNGVLVDGQRNTYRFYDSAGDLQSSAATARIYPHTFERYEYTWASGSPVINGWQHAKTLSAYNAASMHPRSILLDGYTAPITLAYSPRHLLTGLSFIDHHMQWLYYGASKLLYKQIGVDGQEILYNYDGAARLSSIGERQGAVGKTITYDYIDGTHIKNSIGERTNYIAVSTLSQLVERENIKYYDPLGRPILDLAVRSSPSLQDVGIATEYDVHGRKRRTSIAIESPLPFNGIYFEPEVSAPSTFMSYEANLLNRVKGVVPPSWYETTQTYTYNTTPIAVPGGTTYAEATLYKEASTDPDGKKLITFKDKLGLTIATVAADLSESQAAYTWHIYDDKNRLVHMIQPGGSMSTPELLFTHVYDGDDNLISKKKPSATTEQYVYSQRNLEIGMRNAILQAQGRWLVSHYDAYGRLTKQGYHTLSGMLPATENPTIHVLLIEKFYDGYNGSTTNADPIYKGKLTREWKKTLEDAAPNSSATDITYTYDSYGRVAQTTMINHLGAIETTTTTYDNADLVLETIHTAYGKTDRRTHSYDTQGRLIDDNIDLHNTGLRTLSHKKYNYRGELIENNIGKHPTTSSYLQSTDYAYNAQGWLTDINTVDEHAASSSSLCMPESDIIMPSNEGTGPGDLYSQKITYYNGIGTPKNGNISQILWRQAGTHRERYDYGYDYQNRLTTATFGQLANIENTTPPYKNYGENFSYDIRGNILKLNRRGMVSHYDLLTETHCYAAALIDSLTYIYPPNSNQLTKVEDKVPCVAELTLPPVIDRDMTYAATNLIIADATEVQCHAYVQLITNGELRVKDNLTIKASCGAAPTVRVSKAGCSEVKYSPGFAQLSQDSYLYDASGNTTYDPNKKLTYHYNYLNLCYKITGAEHDELITLYSADGTLLQRRYVKDNATVSTRDYIGDKTYKNGTLEEIHHSDGRILIDGTTHTYEYSLKDHLGNVRTTFADLDNDGAISSTEIRSRNDYYAFGMLHEGTYRGSEIPSDIANRQLYNNKELISEMNADLLYFNTRQFDPVLGRFLEIDKISSAFPHVSPYNYAENEPVGNVDLWGLQKVNINDLRNAKGEIISRKVNIIASVKLLNLSSNDSYMFNGSLTRATPMAKELFGTSFQSQVFDTKTKNLTKNSVNVDVSFSLAIDEISSISQIKSTDFVSIIVDELSSSSNQDIIGYAQVDGNLSLVDKDFLNNNSAEIFLHEIGHNLGLGHSSSGKGLMGAKSFGQTAVSINQRNQVAKGYGATSVSHEETYNNNSSEILNFLNKQAKKYDHSKFKKAGF